MRCVQRKQLGAPDAWSESMQFNHTPPPPRPCPTLHRYQPHKDSSGEDLRPSASHVCTRGSPLKERDTSASALALTEHRLLPFLEPQRNKAYNASQQHPLPLSPPVRQPPGASGACQTPLFPILPHYPHYSPLFPHYSPLFPHYSPLFPHYSPIIPHSSPILPFPNFHPNFPNLPIWVPGNLY